TGLADAVLRRVAAGRPTLGLCGGFQMLSRRIVDAVESGAGEVEGLGVLPVSIDFGAEKMVGRTSGATLDGIPVHGYEIHHGRATVHSGAPVFITEDGGDEGCRVGNTWGTHWHGAFESDDFRRAFLTEVAAASYRHGFTVAPDTNFAALRVRTID